jgi:taurine dioxygenase
MYLAYDTLSETMKRLLEDLVCLHETEVPDQADLGSRHLARYGTEHPVVATHPETGRKLLFVNKTYSKLIKGMTLEESEALLGFLCRHATKAEHVWRLQWQPGTLAFWDNRCTQHRPMNDYHGYRREMHRVTIERTDRVA